MSPRRAIPEKKKEGGLPPWVIFGAVIIIAVVGVIGVVQIMGTLQGTATAPVPNLAAAGRTRGDPKAPIALVEYSDFQ